MPSRTTFKWLIATTLLASLACFLLLSQDVDCGAQSWDCATHSGVALVSLIAGLGLGSFLTAAVVILGWGYLLMRPSACTPETKSRSASISAKLFAVHLLFFGVMQVMGTLPMGWIWWLGMFGVIGMHPSGSVYIVNP